MEARQHIIMGNIDDKFIKERVHIYAEKVHDCTHALTYCIAFIDGTVISIVGPGMADTF